MTAVTALLALPACGGSDSTPPRGGTSAPPATPSGGRLAVVATDNAFDPALISVPSGAAVTVVMANKGVAPHTFTVEELNVDVEVKADQTLDIGFTPERTGTFKLICKYHLPGMTGQVTVT